MKKDEDYPDFTGFIDVLDREGLTEELVSKLTARHATNRLHTKNLYERYK
nr:MAG TPA: hypothetical protein [Caudoviricetes sp.]